MLQTIWLNAKRDGQQSAFRWENGKLQMSQSYSNWEPGQPGNATSGDCVAMLSHDTWFNTKCNDNTNVGTLCVFN